MFELLVTVALKCLICPALSVIVAGVSDEELDGLARLKDAQTTRLLPLLNRHYAAADRSWHKHFKLLQELKAEQDNCEKDMAEINATRVHLKRLFQDSEATAQNEPRPSVLFTPKSQAGSEND